MDRITVTIIGPNIKLQQEIRGEIEKFLPMPDYTDRDRADFYAYIVTDGASLPQNLSSRLAGMATMLEFYSIMEKAAILHQETST